MPEGRRLRVILALITLCCLAVLGGGFVAAQDGDDLQGSEAAVESALNNDTNASVVDPRDNITVVTADSTAVLTDGGQGPRTGAELIAFAPNGSIYYHTTTRTRYWDVDPVEGTHATVEYVYSDHLPPMECPGQRDCTRNGIERLNLTTGETTNRFARRTPNVSGTRWHDADRIGEDRYLVADIDQDRVFVANTTTNETTWEWDAETDFDTAEGGTYPEDWTHINDVEYVELDGRPTVMVSVRNFDRVVFVDMERGLREEWTLGTGDHDILYEQHNPDFIPPENGGPAVIVADSENGRVVEYQREDGAWNRTWQWQDARMTWPRDADRLPNGHTLMADSNGDRVLEIDDNGSVVWAAELGFPYEIERLGTGDESTGGPGATTIASESQTPSATNRSVGGDVAAAAPPSLVNAAAYLRPGWVGTAELLAAAGLAIVVPVWTAVESRRRVTFQAEWPFIDRDR